jgi:hypothetical protein
MNNSDGSSYRDSLCCSGRSHWIYRRNGWASLRCNKISIYLEAETSASITAGTNLSVSTLGAISGAINHYRQNNIDLKIFLVMALSGAIGTFVGSFLIDLLSLN